MTERLEVIEDKSKIVTIRLTEELHRKARKRLPDEGSSFQALLTGWLEEWLADEKEMPAVHDARAGESRANQRWHDLLSAILKHANRDVCAMVKLVLKNHGQNYLGKS
jgi:hypothetical protein